MTLTIWVDFFDEPLGRGVRLPHGKQVDITLDGVRAVTDLLMGMGVRATFIISERFDGQVPELKARLVKNHEVNLGDKPRINYWRSIRILPLGVGAWLARRESLVFSAWEFSGRVEGNKDFRLPFVLSRISGTMLVKKLAVIIDRLSNNR